MLAGHRDWRVRLVAGRVDGRTGVLCAVQLIVDGVVKFLVKLEWQCSAA